jgi:hypothetical protein
VGLWFTVGVGLLLVGVGARMRDSATLRRSVGVLWDLTTFWPRAAHPFGPPCYACYAERVVPEVTARAVAALEDGRYVVLSAHSQGSTIAAAALLQLRDRPGVDYTDWQRIRLICYGSQLRAWFGRLFPDLLGPDVLGHAPTERAGFRTSRPADPPAWTFYEPPEETLAHALDVGQERPHWRGLFRRTDPLGFPVHQDAVPEATPAHEGPVLVDEQVPELEPLANRYTAPVVHTHSRYQASPQYAAIVTSWIAEASCRPPPCRRTRTG